MKFELSANIAIQCINADKAREFYSECFGFRPKVEKPDFAELYEEPITIFIQKDAIVSGVVMELFVENLEEAKQYLLNKGCTIIRWEGKGKDCYIEDPFGVRFNIWER